jgi:hypothetical protein
MSRSGGSTFKRCGCRDPRTGRQLGRRCPHLRERGHGSWYLAVELSAAPDGRPASASPAGRLRHPRCRAGGTWPTGQTGLLAVTKKCGCAAS